MTMEELVIAIRVTAEDAQEELDAVRGGLERMGAAGKAGMTQLRKETLNALRTVERAQKDAYSFAVKWIEQRRNVGKLTAQQEIAELERVRREYAMTAEQIIDVEERLYEARRALREGEEGQLTTLYSAVSEALAARYEEQREAEKARIDESIAAWQAWSDKTCAAIRQQLDALDDQAQAQERTRTQEEHMRGINRLEEALIYEKDAYNRMQLEKQLKKAREEWAGVQSGWARQDERAALESQMEAAAQRAQAEMEALRQESSRIDDVYAQMLSSQNLAVQAQKALMESAQEELIALLVTYAPDYEATGRSLGEKMYAGFRQAFGDVSAFFETFNAQFEIWAGSAQSAAWMSAQNLAQQGKTLANVSSPVINQTVQFNQPVQSPADVARRMQQVSEELAKRI